MFYRCLHNRRTLFAVNLSSWRRSHAGSLFTMKSRRREARDVMYTDATQARRVHDVIDSLILAEPTSVFSPLSRKRRVFHRRSIDWKTTGSVAFFFFSLSLSLSIGSVMFLSGGSVRERNANICLSVQSCLEWCNVSRELSLISFLCSSDFRMLAATLVSDCLPEYTQNYWLSGQKLNTSHSKEDHGQRWLISESYKSTFVPWQWQYRTAGFCLSFCWS